jgi:hypothetical protein
VSAPVEYGRRSKAAHHHMLPLARTSRGLSITGPPKGPNRDQSRLAALDLVGYKLYALKINLLQWSMLIVAEAIRYSTLLVIMALAGIDIPVASRHTSRHEKPTN